MDLMNQVFRQLNEGWFSFNKKTKTFYFNPGWDYIIGLHIEASCTIDKFITEFGIINHSEFRNIFMSCTSDSPIINFTLKTKHKPFIINAHTAEGSEELVIGIMIDGTVINQKVKKLKAEKKQAEYNDHIKSSFLSNMAHDIRVPLTSISGFAEMIIEDEFTDEDKKGFASIIERNTENLVHVVNDIIDVSKIKAGQFELVNSVFEPEHLFLELFTKYQSELDRMKKKDIDLRLKLPKIKDKITLLCDKLRLKQMLEQLLSNAIKFTYTGEIIFGYRLEKNKTIEFFVSDTGIGISKEKQAFIFNFSDTEEESFKKSYGSSGLGLHIVKSIANLMDAQLEYKTEDHKGTRFTFQLPIHKKSKATVKAAQLNANKGTPWTNKKILIVDDSKEVYDYIRLSLRHSKLTCLYANSGKSAIKIMETISDIDLILMDIQMPGKDGIVTLKELRKLKLKIPVIALTAFALTGDKEKFMESGFNEYISKPIKQTDLFRTLKVHL